MSDKDQSSDNPQDMSADDFFAENAPPAQPAQPQDVGDMVKNQLKRSALNSGKQMGYSLLLGFVPIDADRKRSLSRRLAKGEKIGLQEIFFGDVTAGNIIGWIITAIFLVILFGLLISRSS